MKKLTTVILIILFIQVNVSSQGCLPNGITFNTQSQIDSFQINYPNCTEIQGDVEITGIDITNLNGLSVLTAFGGDLSIFANDSLTSLTGLDNVTNVTSTGGVFFIFSNDNLTTLAGLENVVSVGGHFIIHHNNALTNLSGLNNLSSIGGEFGLLYNPLLTSLTELDNLSSIGGSLGIGQNSVLKDLSGLGNINANSISELHIIFNDSLTTCEVQSVCDYLASPSGAIDIHDNAAGCNTQLEVENACTAVGIKEDDKETETLFYPNPVTNELFILDENRIITEVNIYNQLGQKVLKETRLTGVIDVSILRKGMYVVEVVSDSWVVREKLLVR